MSARWAPIPSGLGQAGRESVGAVAAPHREEDQPPQLRPFEPARSVADVPLRDEETEFHHQVVKVVRQHRGVAEQKRGLALAPCQLRSRERAEAGGRGVEVESRERGSQAGSAGRASKHAEQTCRASTVDRRVSKCSRSGSGTGGGRGAAEGGGRAPWRGSRGRPLASMRRRAQFLQQGRREANQPNVAMSCARSCVKALVRAFKNSRAATHSLGLVPHR